MNSTTALEALQAIDALLSAIDTDGLPTLVDRDLVAVMRTARRLKCRFDALACVATALVDGRKSSMKTVGTPTTSLIALDDGIDNRQAAGQIAQAKNATAHESAMKAALDGEITCEHAAAITKGIDSLPHLPADVVDKLAEAFVAKARDTSPRKLAQLAPSILAEVAPDHALTNDALEDRAVRQREKAVESRSFLWGNDGEGSVWFKGQLPEAEAEPLVRTLTAMVAAGKREELDHDKQLRDAGADPLTRHHHRSSAKRRTPAQRAADALTQLLNQVLDGGTGTGRTSEGGPRAMIRVTMTLDDLTTRAAAGGLLDTGTELTAGQLRRMLAEADIIPAVLGGESEILDWGRARRLATPAQRQMIELRDGGCIFPNCTAPPEACQIHHTDPWGMHGDTDASTMVLLCPHHHGIIEPDKQGRRDQWSIAFNPATAKPEVTPPKRLNTA